MLLIFIGSHEEIIINLGEIIWGRQYKNVENCIIGNFKVILYLILNSNLKHKDF